jgi:hypothetical protein
LHAADVRLPPHRRPLLASQKYEHDDHPRNQNSEITRAGRAILVWAHLAERRVLSSPRPKKLAHDRARRIVFVRVPSNPSLATVRRVGRLLFDKKTRVLWAAAAEPLPMYQQLQFTPVPLVIAAVPSGTH